MIPTSILSCVEKIHKTVRVMNITKVISRPAVDDKQTTFDVTLAVEEEVVVSPSTMM